MNIETGLRYAALAAVAVAIGMGVKKQLLIFRFRFIRFEKATSYLSDFPCFEYQSARGERYR